MTAPAGNHAVHPPHGGDLADALDAAKSAAQDAGSWLNLSTGISPNAYPLPALPPDCWNRLPGRRETDALLRAASLCYGAPSPAHVTAAPGSQALIQALPAGLPNMPVTIISPTYGGHEPAWTAAGFQVRMAETLDDCDAAGITALVNPNNPDGRTVFPEALEPFARDTTRSGGWLIVDEAFCDLEPELSSAGLVAGHNVVVLRSFGKFFGLAGLRLGFALAPEAMARRISERLGPWAVSGPALAIGAAALADTQWQDHQRKALAQASLRLDGLLTRAGFHQRGGTDLFRLAVTEHAGPLFEHLLERRIYVRRFDEHPRWLRIGLPGPERDWLALEKALTEFGS